LAMLAAETKGLKQAFGNLGPIEMQKSSAVLPERQKRKNSPEPR